MLSQRELSDRFEIQQLLIDYSTAIDNRRFDDLVRMFTPDAYIDYRAMGGIDGRFPEVKAWLADVLPNFPAYAHLLGNFDVRIDGDAASSRTICFNPVARILSQPMLRLFQRARAGFPPVGAVLAQ
jgi:hypothetical protein